jgi:hypothetical protein
MLSSITTKHAWEILVPKGSVLVIYLLSLSSKFTFFAGSENRHGSHKYFPLPGHWHDVLFVSRGSCRNTAVLKCVSYTGLLCYLFMLLECVVPLFGSCSSSVFSMYNSWSTSNFFSIRFCSLDYHPLQPSANDFIANGLRWDILLTDFLSTYPKE